MIEKYLESWAKELGVDNNPWAIAEYLVNTAKNYDTACAIMFGLSWSDEVQKAYLRRAADAMALLPTQYPDTHFPADWLYQWLVYYTEEVEKLP